MVKCLRISNHYSEHYAKQFSKFLRLCEGHSEIDKFLKNKFEEQLEKRNFISIQEIDVLQFTDYQSILGKYKNVEPPFSKSKREEFKDAYALLAIESFITLQELDLVGFISEDNDWTEYLKSKTNYIASLDDIKDFLTKKEKDIEQKEYFEAREKEHLKQWRKEKKDELKIKLAEAIDDYVDEDNEIFSELVVREIKYYYEVEYKIYDMLGPIEEYAVDRHVEIDEEGLQIEIERLTILSKPSLNEDYDDSLELEDYDDHPEFSLTGRLDCSIEFTLHFGFSYDEFETASFDDGDVFPHSKGGGEATLEGKAFIEFNCTGNVFSGGDFEVDTEPKFKIVKKGSLEFI